MLVFFESSKVLVSIGNKISEMHTGKKENHPRIISSIGFQETCKPSNSLMTRVVYHWFNDCIIIMKCAIDILGLVHVYLTLK